MDWKNTLKLRALAALKIPMIAFVGPAVEYLDETKCVLRVPFGWRTKNQLGSMFFGALTTTADATYGLLYFKLLESRDHKIPGIIKEFQVSFTKRVEADAIFTCNDGNKISALLDRATVSAERVEDWIEVVATVPTKFGAEPVAKFRMLVSMKKSSSSRSTKSV